MPADYQSAAQALALSPSPSSGSPTLPPWSRRTMSPSSRRVSNPLMRPSKPPSFPQRITATVRLLGEQVLKVYLRMSPLQRLLAASGVVAILVLVILGMVFSHRFFAWLSTISERWRALPGGWLISFFMIFVTAFPPIMGYSTAATIAGFVFGFPWGWPIVAAGCTVGSLGAFLASRTVLSKYVDRMVGHDHRFIALAQVLKQDGVLYLTAIRFCPLPFSLSNGFLATIPSITPLAFTLSTALSSPKLLVHVFIGSRLAVLVEKDDKMSLGDKVINYLSIVIGSAIGLTVGLIIYRRTMARAAELAREEALAGAAEEGEGGYEDHDAALLDPEDAAALMTDDDISLWERQDEYRDADDSEYRDEDEPNGKKGGAGGQDRSGSD